MESASLSDRSLFSAKLIKLAAAGFILAASAYYAAQCERRGADFRTMWGACRLVLEGKYLYSVVGVPGANGMIWRNPPFFTFAVAPLGLLELRTAAYVWFYFKLGLILWMGRGLKRLSDRWAPGRSSKDDPADRHSPGAYITGRVLRLRIPGQARGPNRPWNVWGPALLCAAWFNNDLTIGHMNLVASALAVSSLIAFLERRDLATAVWGSLAVCAKGPAVFLVLFYAAWGRFRPAAMTAGLCLLWTALPAFVWGPAQTLHYNRTFLESVKFETIYADPDNGWAENWGVPELAMRLMGQVHPRNGYGKALEWFHTSPETAVLCTKMLMVALTLALAGWWWRQGRFPALAEGFSSPQVHHSGLAATASLVLSPVTRKAYLGTLFLPYFILWGYVFSRPSSPRKRRVACLFGLSVLLGTMIHTDILSRPVAFFFSRWHVLTFSLLALTAAQILAAHETEKTETCHDD